jgi:hypothetical protein
MRSKASAPLNEMSVEAFQARKPTKVLVVSIRARLIFSSLKKVCKANDVVLILDEVQSGFDEGKFFAHQYHDIKPDIICMAKGMGNGFPIGGILIAPHFKASYGLLGTTLKSFGLRSKYRCFRYYRKSELNGECCKCRSIFHGKKLLKWKRIDARR